jgi:hypothetical protein
MWKTAKMKAHRSAISLVLGFAVPLAYGQKNTDKQQLEPVGTSVCRVFDDPSAYNNRLVKVRGYVHASFEFSVLSDERCPEHEIWFAFADGSALPQLEATANGSGAAGGRDSKGRQIPPVPMHLVRDANYTELMHYLAASAKGEACADGPPPSLPPDCTTYRVTATFTGRIDGVTNLIHEAHLKRSSGDRIDGKGFGHMGMFDAQIVVQSVESVVAVDEAELRKHVSKPK